MMGKQGFHIQNETGDKHINVINAPLEALLSHISPITL